MQEFFNHFCSCIYVLVDVAGLSPGPYIYIFSNNMTNDFVKFLLAG